VILLSEEPSVGSLFELAIDAHDRLIVAANEDELRAALDSPAETVVIDLPAGERVETWERVRALHAGMVLVAVDRPDETQDWPPDLGRRFLVRPLRAEEIAEALAVRPPILREPTTARRRRLAQPRRPPVVPPPVAEADGAPRAIQPQRRLSTDESVWEERNGTAAAAAKRATRREPEPPSVGLEPGSAASRRPESTPARLELDPLLRRRLGLAAAAMVLLLASAVGGGIAIGRATASPDRHGGKGAGPSATSASTAAPAPNLVVKERTPEACNAALSDADAAVSYLAGNIRDQRLTQSMLRYQEDRRACRQVSR
jgi:hypothetical protein